MSDKTEEAIQKSTDYYNSSDTDAYYRKIWGGESIHVGIFDEPDFSIRDAARRALHPGGPRVGPDPRLERGPRRRRSFRSRFPTTLARARSARAWPCARTRRRRPWRASPRAAVQTAAAAGWS